MSAVASVPFNRTLVCKYTRHENVTFFCDLQMATYTFVFPNKEGTYMRVLLPLFDLINHKGTGANTYVGKDAATGSYHLIATKDIKCVLPFTSAVSTLLAFHGCT